MGRFLIAVLVGALTSLVVAQPYDSSYFAGLHWRLIGPFRGGRALAVTGVPGQPEKFYFGAVGGGVWESDNAGRTWNPIFDKVHTASIGAIAVAPSDPNVVYVGTGEADMRSDIQQGNGMYKSVDAGKTWTHIGLEDTRQIGKVLIDPKDPNTVYVAALGHQYGPNAERGVFKTTDGGATWVKVLYRDPNIGAIDLDMDPSDSNVIFAALWSTRRPPWSVYPPSNGPGGGLFKSTDGGKSWSQIEGHGFPASTGRIGVSVSPADHSRVYACVDTIDPKAGGVYRSDDGGANWSRTDGEARIWGRGWYFCGVTADPKTPDTVYVMNTSTYRSTDGGRTFIPIKGAPGGDDYHTLWIAPNDPSHMILGSDQGVVVSVDGAKTWSSWYNQPTGQFYHVITDNRFPYWVYGAQQDSGAMAVPSRTIHTGISSLDWRPIDAGGESGTIAPDPLHPGLLYSSGGSKEDFDTAWEQTIDPTLLKTDTVWRNEWTMPIVVSPTDPHVFYLSHQQIFRTQDGGASWQIISPDLTRSKDAVPSNLDHATAADTTGPRNGVVYWIAPSPVRAHEIWAGTDDGYIWLTRDEGQHWQNMTPPEFGPWSKVGVIDASHFDAETAYAAIDRHRLDDNHPYIYRTHDGGKHWKLITNGLPSTEFVNVVREDPERAGLLYAGTDWGVFVSFDDGANWQPLQLDLPAASVRDIVFQNGDVVVGTHGRAIYVLDDASLLRQVRFSPSVDTLFLPRTTVLFQRAGTFGFGQFNEGTPLPPEEPQGENPPWGVIVDYYLANGAKSLVFTITDVHGRVIRRMSSTDRSPSINLNALDIPAYWVRPGQTLSAARGAHRFVWDLRYGNANGPFVAPGTYAVNMVIGNSLHSSPFNVTRDPRVKATDAELRAQYDLAVEMEDEISTVRTVRDRATRLLAARGSSLSESQRAQLRAVIGARPGRRAGRRGRISPNVSSLGSIESALGALSGALESAPAAPNPEYQRAFVALKKRVAADMGVIDSLR